jgi:hypothetical protein
VKKKKDGNEGTNDKRVDRYCWDGIRVKRREEKGEAKKKKEDRTNKKKARDTAWHRVTGYE